MELTIEGQLFIEWVEPLVAQLDDVVRTMASQH